MANAVRLPSRERVSRWGGRNSCKPLWASVRLGRSLALPLLRNLYELVCGRDEFLALEQFESLAAARKLTALWKEDYNHRRPHGSLGYVAPAVFAARCPASATELASATPQPTPPLQLDSGVTLTETFIAAGTGI